MNEEELKEIMLLLENAGWQPQLCDTPLPAYESVHAGNPTEPGQLPEDMIMMPKAFLSMCPENMVRVIGNSMVDAGISDGDCYSCKKTPPSSRTVEVIINLT